MYTQLFDEESKCLVPRRQCSSLDLVVFGRSSSKRCSKIIDKEESNCALSKSSYSKIIDRFEKIRLSSGKYSISKIRTSMQHCMQRYCAVYRSGKELLKGRKILIDLLENSHKLKIKDKYGDINEYENEFEYLD